MASFRGFLALLVLPIIAAKHLRIRVDDDTAVYQDGVAVINSHVIPGWQWTSVYEAEVNAEFLVLTAWNQGGPGGILLTVDGQLIPLDKWKCNRMDSQAQKPEDKYPGVLASNYDDSAWRSAVAVNNAWGNTAGFSNQQWFWGGPQSDKMVICRTRLREPAKPAVTQQCVYPEPKQRAMKIRVDDDVAVYQGNVAVVNSHIIPGWQWTTVYDATINTNLIVLTAFNQGGPGGILVQIDGVASSADQWKCNTMASQTQSPEAAYPGVLSIDFDDSNWSNAVSVNNAWGSTAGFANNNAWFWGNPTSAKMVICRMKLAECQAPAPVVDEPECVYPDPVQKAMKIRVDDDVAVYQGNVAVVNSHIIPGWQWTTVYDATINTNLIVLTAFNQGGPGGILVQIDGVASSADQWKCNTMASQTQSPEAAYPGVLSIDFDDSNWSNAVSVNNAWGSTAGFANNNAWFWGNPTSAKMVICRMKLAECRKPEIAVDPIPEVQPEPEVVEPEVVEPEVVEPEVVEPEIVEPEVEPEPEVVEPEPTCVKQREMWAAGEVDVEEPALTEDCKFELKQCNNEKCFCVSAKKGVRQYGTVEVPLDDSYDCSRKPRKCQKKRFSLILKNKDGFIPVCAKSGHYEKKQCYEGECWCVKPKGGKEVRKTRTTGELEC